MGLLTDADKEQVKRHIPKASNKIIDATVARLYIAYPDATQWTYTGLSGAIALVDDLVGHTFFLKMVDISGNQGIVWDQELYVNFEYNQDRKFFHTFEIEDCLAGLLFEDTKDAVHFHKRVSTRSKHASKATVNNKQAVALAERVQSKEPTQGSRGEFIDSNTAQRLRHARGVLYYDDLPPPEWRLLYAELEAAGITEDMIADNREFIKDYITKQGGPLVGLEPPIPRRFAHSTAPVVTSLASKKKKAPPPPPGTAPAVSSNLPSDTPTPTPEPEGSKKGLKSWIPPLLAFVLPPQGPYDKDLPQVPDMSSDNDTPETTETLTNELSPTPEATTATAAPVAPPAPQSRRTLPPAFQGALPGQQAAAPVATAVPKAPTVPAATPPAPTSTHRIPPPIISPVSPQQSASPVLPGRGPVAAPPPPPRNLAGPPPPPPRSARAGPPPPPPRARGAAPPPPPRLALPPAANVVSPPPISQPAVASPPPPPRQLPQPSMVAAPPLPPAPVSAQVAPPAPPPPAFMGGTAPPAPPPPPPAFMGSAAPPAPAPPPNLGGGVPPPPPPPNLGGASSAPALPPVDGGRDALLSAIRGAGGIGSLKKTDKTQLEKPSVLLQEAKGEAPPASASPADGGLAGALAAALSQRKNKVAQSDDEDDDEW